MIYKDLYHGPTSILPTAAAAPALGDPTVSEAYNMFRQRVAEERDSLVERITDLKDRIDEAIDAVEAELGERGQVPAARREYAGLPAAEFVPSSSEKPDRS